MKRLHRLMIGAYYGPLALTFLIVLFILSMQFLWKYVDDLMGKGLPWYTLTELMLYATASFVPLAIPLGVLLSSIMTLGALGENSELTPLRSAGLGLFRILWPLIVFVTLLAGASFLFSNNVLPIANLKFHSLLWDVTQKKPALNIRPGVFYNGIEGFSIRVMEKDDDTGLLHDVLIYDHRREFTGARTVLRARQGTMRRSTDGRYLVLTLEDGHFYDERSPTGGERGRDPLVRGTFVRDEMRFDLTGLGLARVDEDLFKDHYKMLTLGQLQHAEDSLEQQFMHRSVEQERHMRNALAVLRDSVQRGTEPQRALSSTAFLRGLNRDQRDNIFEIARNMVRNQLSFLERVIEERDGRAQHLARFRVEWHRKLTLAAACLIFFFIGAPLGAIVRKGGLGLPTVFAIVFFLIFHIISYSTERLVIAGRLPAWPGMWTGTFVLLPIGIWLTWKAATDSPLLDRDAYYRAIDRFRSFLRQRRHADPTAVQ
ncbi:MAG: LptF/LptG family permease [Flavobacteriales bacterium]|nr:LptF/LptG family permease [Flavobacteriales bacterium]